MERIRERHLKNPIPILVTIGFSIAGVQKIPIRSASFYAGFAVYASTEFGWVYVMRHLKLAIIGVVYSISMILLLTGIGAIAFREPLSSYEVAGLAMAVRSLILLMRFA